MDERPPGERDLPCDETEKRLAGMEQALAEQKKFFNHMAHEMKTPLTAIIGYAKLAEQLLDGAEAINRDRINPCLQGILKSSNRMLQLVEQLLMLARLGAHKTPFHFAPTNLLVLCEGVANELKPLLREKSLTFHIDPPAIPPVALVDADKLTQVFMNLMSNAIKFSPPNGLVHLFFERGHREIVTFIKDQGAGIPESELSSIFNSFERGSHSQNTPGTGLGLPICREIVEGHGGRIWATNGAPVGAIFAFSLPLKGS